MTPAPDLTRLYADVAAHGSLAAALEAIADAAGTPIDVVADERQPLYNATVPSATPLRKALGISAGAVERVWIIVGWSEGIWAISGSTGDLGEVVKAAVAWRDGMPLRDVQQAASFVEVTTRGQAAERDPSLSWPGSGMGSCGARKRRTGPSIKRLSGPPTLSRG